MSTELQKKQAKAVQTRLKELGFDVKLGQAYQVIAALEGDKSWNVTSAKVKSGSSDSGEIFYRNGKGNLYEIVVTGDVKASCTINIRAEDFLEAHKKVNAIIYDHSKFEDGEKFYHEYSNASNWEVDEEPNYLPKITNIEEVKSLKSAYRWESGVTAELCYMLDQEQVIREELLKVIDEKKRVELIDLVNHIHRFLKDRMPEGLNIPNQYDVLKVVEIDHLDSMVNKNLLKVEEEERKTYYLRFGSVKEKTVKTKMIFPKPGTAS